MKPGLISIVLPVHNQADHIGTVLKGYSQAMSRVTQPHEFILVVNGCRDNSLQVCRQLAGEFSTVKVVHSAEGGWGRAVRLGLQAADGEWLCYTNSARTAPSDLVLLTLYGIANPDGVVKAHRRSRESLKRKLGSFLYNLQGRVLFDLPTWDINATPKVFSRDVYERITLDSNGDLIDLEFYVKCQALGIVVLEVPIYSQVRLGGKSTTTYSSAVKMYSGAYRLWRSLRGSAVPSRP